MAPSYHDSRCLPRCHAARGVENGGVSKHYHSACTMYYTMGGRSFDAGRGGELSVPPAISTTPIRDFSWMSQLLSGAVRERFSHNGYRVAGLELEPTQKSPYRYRLLFFRGSERKPVLSLNLETSLLGSPCFTVHRGSRHQNLKTVDAELSYAEFRRIALETADELLV